MNPQRMVDLHGTITHRGKNNELWTIEAADYVMQNNPGRWERYYVTSTRGYCSDPYRSLISALNDMLRLAANSDFDWELEKKSLTQSTL
jgi:hypothetical protein